MTTKLDKLYDKIMTSPGRTHWQKQRDKTRSTRSGKFVKLNPCERCGKSAGANYFSDERANEVGKGLVLCERCADKLAKVEGIENYLAAFSVNIKP